jgi:hypothetical protein
MNTTTINIARLAFAATITALFLGATGCGTEQGDADPAAPVKQAVPQQQTWLSPRVAERHDLARARADARRQALTSIDLIEAAKANQAVSPQRLKAEHRNAIRQARDRRAQEHRTTAHHASGFDKALLAER